MSSVNKVGLAVEKVDYKDEDVYMHMVAQFAGGKGYVKFTQFVHNMVTVGINVDHVLDVLRVAGECSLIEKEDVDGEMFLSMTAKGFRQAKAIIERRPVISVEDLW